MWHNYFRVTLCILLFIFIGFPFLFVDAGRESFDSTANYIQFIESATDQSDLVRQIILYGAKNVRAPGRYNMPDWLKSALSRAHFEELGLFNYLTGIFEVCHSSIFALESCLAYREEYPQIVKAIVFGSIAHVWVKDIHNLFFAYMHIAPFVNVQYAEMPPYMMISNYLTHTWDAVLSNIRKYTHEYDANIMQLHSRINMMLQNSITLAHDDTMLLYAWWNSMRLQYQFAQTTIQVFVEWAQMCQNWIEVTNDFTSNSKKIETLPTSSASFLRSPIRPLDATLSVLNKLKHCPYFYFEPSSDPTSSSVQSFIPYKPVIVKIVNTARAPLLLRLYCTTFEPDVTLATLLMTASYLSFPELILQLSTILIDRDQFFANQAHPQKGGATVMVSKTLQTHSAKLVTTCMESSEALQICEACAVFWPPLYFYLSQAITLHDFYDHFALLYGFEHFNKFALNDFNLYLMRLYLRLRFFFKVMPDEYLEKWTTVNYSEDIRDVYQIFRGKDALWNARPPTAYTTSSTPLNFSKYNLPFFWTRCITWLSARRDEWWQSLLSMATMFDKWVKRTNRQKAVSAHTKGETVHDIIMKKSMLEAIVYMTEIAVRVRTWSDETLIPDAQLGRSLSRSYLDVSGNIDALRVIFTACHQQRQSFTKKWNEKLKLRSSQRHGPAAPSLPTIPVRSALLHEQQQLNARSQLDLLSPQERLNQGMPLVLDEDLNVITTTTIQSPTSQRHPAFGLTGSNFVESGSSNDDDDDANDNISGQRFDIASSSRTRTKSLKSKKSIKTLFRRSSNSE